MSRKTVIYGTFLGMLFFSESIGANLLDVKKAVEGAVCKNLAASYAKNPSALTVQSIAQLQICLAQTLQAAPARAIPRNFDIQTPPPSSSQVEATLPTPPTPPTPPSSIKIP